MGRVKGEVGQRRQRGCDTQIKMCSMMLGILGLIKNLKKKSTARSHEKYDEILQIK